MKTPKTKAVDEAKLIAKIRDNWTCQKCSARDAQMHGSHIMPVTWNGTAADPDNILCLCAGCHKMKRDSWHEDPIENARWFEAKYPGKYDLLNEKALTYSKNPFPKIDWLELRKELIEKRKLLEEEIALTT